MNFSVKYTEMALAGEASSPKTTREYFPVTDNAELAKTIGWTESEGVYQPDVPFRREHPDLAEEFIPLAADAFFSTELHIKVLPFLIDPSKFKPKDFIFLFDSLFGELTVDTNIFRVIFFVRHAPSGDCLNALVVHVQGHQLQGLHVLDTVSEVDVEGIRRMFPTLSTRMLKLRLLASTACDAVREHLRTPLMNYFYDHTIRSVSPTFELQAHLPIADSDGNVRFTPPGNDSQIPNLQYLASLEYLIKTLQSECFHDKGFHEVRYIAKNDSQRPASELPFSRVLPSELGTAVSPQIDRMMHLRATVFSRYPEALSLFNPDMLSARFMPADAPTPKEHKQWMENLTDWIIDHIPVPTFAEKWLPYHGYKSQRKFPETQLERKATYPWEMTVYPDDTNDKFRSNVKLKEPVTIRRTRP